MDLTRLFDKRELEAIKKMAKMIIDEMEEHVPFKTQSRAHGPLWNTCLLSTMSHARPCYKDSTLEAGLC